VRVCVVYLFLNSFSFYQAVRLLSRRLSINICISVSVNAVIYRRGYLLHVRALRMRVITGHKMPLVRTLRIYILLIIVDRRYNFADVIYWRRVRSGWAKSDAFIIIKFNGWTRVIYCLPRRPVHVIVITAATRELI